MFKRIFIIIVLILLVFFVYRHYNPAWANKLLDKVGVDFLKTKSGSWIILTWEIDQNTWDTFTFQEWSWILNTWNQTWEKNILNKLPAIETDKIPDTKITDTGKIITPTTTPTTTTKKTTTTPTYKSSSSQDRQDVDNLLNNIN